MSEESELSSHPRSDIFTAITDESMDELDLDDRSVGAEIKARARRK